MVRLIFLSYTQWYLKISKTQQYQDNRMLSCIEYLQTLGNFQLPVNVIRTVQKPPAFLQCFCNRACYLLDILSASHADPDKSTKIVSNETILWNITSLSLHFVVGFLKWCPVPIPHLELILHRLCQWLLFWECGMFVICSCMSSMIQNSLLMELGMINLEFCAADSSMYLPNLITWHTKFWNVLHIDLVVLFSMLMLCLYCDDRTEVAKVAHINANFFGCSLNITANFWKWCLAVLKHRLQLHFVAFTCFNSWSMLLPFAQSEIDE